MFYKSAKKIFQFTKMYYRNEIKKFFSLNVL